MPIYEYVCKACGAESEILQKVSEQPAKECPVCHKKKLVKTISAAGFRLAGGGWYETDFKSGNKRNVVEKDAPKADSAAPASSGTDKPGAAAKTEAKGEPKKPEPKGKKKSASAAA